MNSILRITLSLWIFVGALSAFFGCAIVGFILAFTDYNFMYNVTPLMSFTALFMSFYCIRAVNRSNPADYVMSKMEALLGKLRVFRKPKKKGRKSSRK